MQLMRTLVPTAAHIIDTIFFSFIMINHSHLKRFSRHFGFLNSYSLIHIIFVVVDFMRCEKQLCKCPSMRAMREVLVCSELAFQYILQ
jgi:hypothetical protein